MFRASVPLSSPALRETKADPSAHWRQNVPIGGSRLPGTGRYSSRSCESRPRSDDDPGSANTRVIFPANTSCGDARGHAAGAAFPWTQ